ncbi:MAG: peptidylprolyl isomerase [Acidobacteriaceae bacterium]|nr:peptidylprolyl isomerase [Acidobacteriaceae bacterium]
MTARLLLSGLMIFVPGFAAAQSSSTDQLPDAPSTTAGEVAPAIPTGPTVVIDTTMGRMTCKLFSKEAPLASENFIGLATGTKTYTDPVTQKPVSGKPFYDGTTFHRVIPGFMIQGGDRLGTGAGDGGYFFDNEVSPSLRFDVPGRLAMANSGPNTNGTQFFITEAPQPSLNGGYTIFGQCDAHSVLIVGTIARVQRNAEDKPVVPVIINKISIVPDGQALPPVPPGPQNVIPDGATPITHPPAVSH